MSGSEKADTGIDLAELVTAASRRVASQRLVSGTLPDMQKTTMTVYSSRENNPDTVTENKLSILLITRSLSQLIKKMISVTTPDTHNIAQKFKDAYIASRK